MRCGVPKDLIYRRARALFADTRRGKLACFGLSRLENIMRHSHARGRREMAEQCAELLRTGAAESDGVHLSAMANQCDLWAKEAGADERRWL